MCCVQKINNTWEWTEIDSCKIIIWFTSNITCGFISKHILQCTYNITQKNWIDTFYYLLFTDERMEPNNKRIELWYSTYIYTYYFYGLISTCTIAFFYVLNFLITNERTILNHYKSIVIFYSLLTYAFQSAIGF